MTNNTSYVYLFLLSLLVFLLTLFVKLIDFLELALKIFEDLGDGSKKSVGIQLVTCNFLIFLTLLFLLENLITRNKVSFFQIDH